MADGFEIAEAYVSVTGDTEGLREDLDAKIKAAAADLDAKIPLDVNAADFAAKVRAAIERGDNGEEVKVPLDVSAADFEAKIKALIDTASEEHVEIEVKADTAEADAKLAETAVEAEAVKEKMNEAGRDPFGQLSASIDNLSGKMDQLGSNASNAGNAAGSAGGAFGGLSGMMMAAVGAALALGPALAALPAILGGLGLGGLAAFGALKDVIGAMSAANQQVAATGQSAAQAAQTAFNNAVQIRNAEQAISDAKRQAAIAAQNSADSITAANQQVMQSEQTEAQAAQALAQAKIDAFNQIADLNNGAADAANSVSDAQLGVQQAQQNLTAVMSNSLSTDLQKKQAQQALIDAEQALTDAKQRAKEATEAADKANQEGVNNFPPVVQAQRAYEQAVLGTANAQHALVIAERNAADQQISSAESVQKAEQSLTDTLRQQQLAAAAAAQTGSSGASAYQQAMAKLTPVGQEVVNMLKNMNSGLDAASQNAFLPGVLAFLKDIQPLMPQFVGMVAEAGRAFGGFIAQIGQLFTQKQFVTEFFTVLQQGIGFMQTVGGGVIDLITGVFSAASKAGPIVTGLGNGILAILQGLSNLFVGLTDNATGAGQTIQAVLGFVGDLLGPVGQLIGLISGALGPALADLRPILDQVVNVLAAALTPVIKALSPILDDVVKVFGVLVQALLPVLPPISQIITILLQAIDQVLTPLMPLIQQLATMFGQELTTQVTTLIPVVQMLVKSLIELLPVVLPLIQDLLQVFQATQPLIPVLTKLATTVLETVIPPLTAFLVWLGKIVDYIVGPIATTFAGLETYMINPIITAANQVESWLSKIQGYWNELTGVINQVPGDIEGALYNMWEPLWQGFKSAINYVIGGWDSLHFTLPSVNLGPFGSFGGETIGVPQIPYLAQGGIVTRAGDVMVGENGPERLTLPQGAAVTPLAGGQSARHGDGMNIGELHLHMNVDGTLDLTNPNALTANARKMLVRIRDGLKLVENAYA